MNFAIQQNSTITNYAAARRRNGDQREGHFTLKGK